MYYIFSTISRLNISIQILPENMELGFPVCTDSRSPEKFWIWKVASCLNAVGDDSRLSRLASAQARNISTYDYPYDGNPSAPTPVSATLFVKHLHGSPLKYDTPLVTRRAPSSSAAIGRRYFRSVQKYGERNPSIAPIFPAFSVNPSSLKVVSNETNERRTTVDRR